MRALDERSAAVAGGAVGEEREYYGALEGGARGGPSAGVREARADVDVPAGVEEATAVHGLPSGGRRNEPVKLQVTGAGIKLRRPAGRFFVERRWWFGRGGGRLILVALVALHMRRQF